MTILNNKFNIIIDGQFGSTGKGLIAGYISLNNDIDIFASNLSPNAGHTFIDETGNKIISKQIPIGSILNKRSMIYLTAGSIINPKKLLDELEKFNIDKNRLFIHPRAAIVDEFDIDWETNLNSSVSKIASTQSGTGKALSDKILRKSKLAEKCEYLKEFIKEINLMNLMDEGCTVLMETSQGFDLGINSGLSYPYCTSRDITTMSILSDAQVHPSYLGKVTMSIRSFPIRVGNIFDKGKLIGYSGPFYNDSEELSWDDLKENPELTTVTGRVRRVASFSNEQYKRSLNINKPDYVFLNFLNYIKDINLLKKLKDIRTPDFVGLGSSICQIYKVKNLTELYNQILRENERKKFNLISRY